MIKRMLLMIAALFVVLGGIFGWKIFAAMKTAEFFANQAPPPVTVTAGAATAENWRPRLEAVGTLLAVNGVEIKAEAAGRITAIHFRSGSDAAKGAVLAQIDDSTERADLISFQAQHKLARHDFERDSALIKKNNVAVATLDKSRAQLEQTEAMIARTQSIIDKKRVKASFAGRLGIRRVDLGDYVEEGHSLVSLQALDPLYVNFTLPEQHYPQVRAGQAVQVRVDAYPDEEFEGSIHAVEAHVDQGTRNFEAQAILGNVALRLAPGMFAKVRVLLPEEEPVVSVPQTAIAYSLYGDSVFVIEENGKDGHGEAVLKVTRRYITAGAIRDNRVAVLKGLEAGERIVTSGQLKLQNGVRVTINNTIQPE